MRHLTSQIERLSGTSRRVGVIEDERPLTFRNVLDGWVDDDDMADAFTDLIAATPFEALFWEMPPLIPALLGNDYECMLIDSPALAGLACDPMPFREYFEGGTAIAVFANLGSDAVLVAPAPGPENGRYPHLAAFCRNAPKSLSRRFWQSLGHAAHDRMGERPTWISTAGLGVGWLHARLDTRPKYYSHDPYRRWSNPE